MTRKILSPSGQEFHQCPPLFGFNTLLKITLHSSISHCGLYAPLLSSLPFLTKSTWQQLVNSNIINRYKNARVEELLFDLICKFSANGTLHVQLSTDMIRKLMKIARYFFIISGKNNTLTVHQCASFNALVFLVNSKPNISVCNQ